MAGSGGGPLKLHSRQLHASGAEEVVSELLKAERVVNEAAEPKRAGVHRHRRARGWRDCQRQGWLVAAGNAPCVRGQGASPDIDRADIGDAR